MVRQQAPIWFRVVAAILLLWGLLGCYACVQQLRLGADAMGPASAVDIALYAELPDWYNPVYVVAVLSGTLGAAALLWGRRVAIPLAIVALATVVVMFGYSFFATDLIALKGLKATVPFPVFIALVAAFQWWLAVFARRRGWIG